MSIRLLVVFTVITLVVAAAFVSVSQSAEAQRAYSLPDALQIPNRVWGTEELGRLKRTYPDRFKDWKVEDGPMWRLDWGPELLAQLKEQHPGKYDLWKVEWGPK